MSDKPDRRIFDVALDRLGLTAEGEGGAAGVVHVGDSTLNDVEGARWGCTS
jgi:FMN phosphatase YigB (HAD superfamily)